MKRHLWIWSLVVVPAAAAVVSSCASKPAPVVTADGAVIHRHLAWHEGDLESNYEPNRTVAESRAAQWEGKIPEPSDVEKYLEYIAVLDASGRGTEAEKRLKSMLAQNPNEKRAVFVLAGHYMRRGKREMALYLFNQLEKDPQFPWKSLLYNNLGMMALKDRNRIAAIAYLEKAVESKPPTPAPLVNLGSLYLQSRSWADAEKLFARARDLDPQFEDASLGLGVALEGQGKWEEAHKIYSEYIDENPGAMATLFNDSVLLGNQLKRREEAAQQMLRYIQRGGKETARAHEIIRSWR